MAIDKSKFLSKTKRNNNQGKRITSRIPARKYFLIICEGTRTEPNYFISFQKHLKENSLGLITAGTGYNTIQVVQEAINQKGATAPNGKSYDQIWAVFDKDSFPASDYNAAIALAIKNNIKCAHTNQAFELWYLLHFSYQQQAAHRSQYASMLNQHLGCRYQKNDPDIYTKLSQKGSQELAIKYAKRLYEYAKNSGNSFANCNPCTTVFELVIELNKHINKP